jgi:hypothetical protein
MAFWVMTEHTCLYLQCSYIFLALILNKKKNFILCAAFKALRALFFNCLNLKMKAIRSFDMSATITATTQRNMPEDLSPCLCKLHGFSTKYGR